jgi:hypothetical protein
MEAAALTGNDADVGGAVCGEHCALVERVDKIADVVGVSNNPLALDSPEYQNTVVGMLVKARRDWKMVKAIGMTIIVVLIAVAVYIQTHSDKQVRETADQILAVKAMVEQIAKKP